MHRLFTITKHLSQNSFWIGCGIISISCIATWFVASSELDHLNASLTREIEANFKTGNKILNVTAESTGLRRPVHPNEKTNHQMQIAIAQTTKSVKKAWTLRCLQQHDHLQPTPEVIEKNQEIAPLLTGIQPAESHTNTQLPESLLAVYKTYVPTILPRLCKIIGTQLGTDQKDLEKTVCRWNSQSQQLWQSKLTQFANRDDNSAKDNLPTASQLTMLEQDLRLLEEMFQVVRITNSENGEVVRSNDLATIKKIDYIVFGREAYSRLGDIVELQPATNSRRNKPEPNSEIDLENQPAFHGRYVDKSGSYISGNSARKAIFNSNGLPEKHLDLVVVRRIPFRIAMRIDERKIGDYIAACENSAIPFHVTQTRINVHNPNEKFSLKGGGRVGTTRAKRQLSASTAGADSETNESKSSDKLGPVESRIRYHVNAEFYGYAKIYRPVNESRLAFGK